MPRKRKSREPKLHRLSDRFTEVLIYFMAIFSPWAFGTTEHWSIWTMNITAYALGVLLVSKWIIRWSTGFRPWPSEAPNNEISPRQHRLRQIYKTCTGLTAVLMLLLLGYILTSAINARASFNLETHEYNYFEGINKSLPHSYDAHGTWFLFWQYLGLIILFWSTRDWLAGARSALSSTSLNPRLKRLLFLICLNGGALALECILQRLNYGVGWIDQHTGKQVKGKLLFMVEPAMNKHNSDLFGPFAYRSNAASYLNLIWPLGLGLLIQLGRENLDYRKLRFGSGPELLLIPCIILTASGPIISSARGGALVMAGLLILSTISILFINIRSTFLRLMIPMSLLAGLGSAYALGWEKIESRLGNILSDDVGGRTQIYDVTNKIIDDYGLFGSGPGSFEAVIQFELGELFTTWASWVHNDYLEFLLTFGQPGMVLMASTVFILLLNMALVLFFGQQKPMLWFGMLSLLGVAIHATADFPLQVLSILIPICLITAMLTSPIEKNKESSVDFKTHPV